MIRCVIFDMDDTLYDERDYCKSGFKSVAQAICQLNPNLKTQLIADRLWQMFESGMHKKLFNALLNELSINYDKSYIEELVKIYRGHRPSIELPAESKTALNQLKQKYNLALLTDGFLPAQKLKVKALDIEDSFDCIIYTEELGREFWKPSPAGFEKILQKFQLPGSLCAYIADNAIKDFIAPNKLGFTTIQLKRPNRNHSAEPPDKNAAPQYVITSLMELPELLERIK